MFIITVGTYIALTVQGTISDTALNTLFTLIYKHFFFLKVNIENQYSLAKWQENIITEVEIK